MMKLISNLLNKTSEEKVKEWRDELWEALPQMFQDETDRYGINDEGNIAIKKGSATVFVDFGISEDGEFGWAIVYSPLVYLPKENLLPFYKRLLDINFDDSVFGTLSTDEDVVYLNRTLVIEGPDEQDLMFNVVTLAEEADDLDDYLVSEFGAQLVEVQVFEQQQIFKGGCHPSH